MTKSHVGKGTKTRVGFIVGNDLGDEVQVGRASGSATNGRCMR